MGGIRLLRQPLPLLLGAAAAHMLATLHGLPVGFALGAKADERQVLDILADPQLTSGRYLLAGDQPAGIRRLAELVGEASPRARIPRLIPEGTALATAVYRFKTDRMASDLWLVRSVTPPGSTH
jgi:hypothetical protein